MQAVLSGVCESLSSADLENQSRQTERAAFSGFCAVEREAVATRLSGLARPERFVSFAKFLTHAPLKTSS